MDVANVTCANAMTLFVKLLFIFYFYFMALWYSKKYNYKLNQESVSNLCSQPNQIMLTIAIYKLQ